MHAASTWLSDLTHLVPHRTALEFFKQCYVTPAADASGRPFLSRHVAAGPHWKLEARRAAGPPCAKNQKMYGHESLSFCRAASPSCAGARVSALREAFLAEYGLRRRLRKTALVLRNPKRLRNTATRNHLNPIQEHGITSSRNVSRV